MGNTQPQEQHKQQQSKETETKTKTEETEETKTQYKNKKEPIGKFQEKLKAATLNTQGCKLEECSRLMKEKDLDILFIQESKIATNSFFRFQDYYCITSSDINTDSSSINLGKKTKEKAATFDSILLGLAQTHVLAQGLPAAEEEQTEEGIGHIPPPHTNGEGRHTHTHTRHT